MRASDGQEEWTTAGLRAAVSTSDPISQGDRRSTRLQPTAARPHRTTRPLQAHRIAHAAGARARATARAQETTNEDAVKIKVTSCVETATRLSSAQGRACAALARCLLLLFLCSAPSSLRVLSRELGRVLVVLRLVLLQKLCDLSSQRIVRVRKLEQLHDLLQHRAGRQGRGPAARKDEAATADRKR